MKHSVPSRNGKGAPAANSARRKRSLVPPEAAAAPSPRPASPFRRLYEVQDTAARGILKEKHEGAERVASEMGELFRPRDDTQGALVSALSAHSLGYIAKMEGSVLAEFWEKTETGMRKLLEEDPDVAKALVISKLKGSNPSQQQVRGKVRRILAYRRDAEEHRAGCHLISDMAALHVSNKDYGELFIKQIEDGTFSVPALVANILDVARNRISETLDSKNALEIAKTAYVVFYPVAETLVLAADIVEAIRKEAIEKILGLEGSMGKAGTVELYDDCATYAEKVEPFARWALDDLTAFLEGADKSEGAISRISRTKKLRVEMISPTVDPEGKYRIKGLSGMFRKIWEKREKGKEYGVDNLPDVVACTCMVDGDLEDAEDVAQAIVSRLVAKYRGKSEGYKIDNQERPTGYQSPHITFRLKVKLGKKEMWIPIDIQVRPESVQRRCLGQWSRGYKVSDDITREVVGQVQADIASISASLRRRDSEPPKAKEKVELEVEVIDEGGDKKRKYPSRQKIEAHPDWKVASVIARITHMKGRGKGGSESMLGFAKSVSVERLEGGESLSLFDDIPEEGILVRIGEEELPRRVCEQLKKADLSDSVAKGMLTRRLRAIQKEKGKRR